MNKKNNKKVKKNELENYKKTINKNMEKNDIIKRQINIKEAREEDPTPNTEFKCL